MSAVATPSAQYLTIAVHDGQLWFDGKPVETITNLDDGTAEVQIDPESEQRTLRLVMEELVKLLKITASNAPDIQPVPLTGRARFLG